MRNAPDYYQVLGLSDEAETDEIQSAYRALALKFHPDRNPGPGAAAEMRRINEAYSCLGDAAARVSFDGSRRAPEPPKLVEAALDAAREILLGGDWRLEPAPGRDMLLAGPPGRVLVRFVGMCQESDADAWLREVELLIRSGKADHSVMLAFRVLDAKALNRATRERRPSATVIELVESRVVGDPFQDPAFRDLFRPFLLSDGPG